MRFDHVTDFRDDDGTVRPAYLLGQHDGRLHVMVTRGVGETHVVSRSSERLVGCHSVRKRGCAHPAA